MLDPEASPGTWTCGTHRHESRDRRLQWLVIHQDSCWIGQLVEAQRDNLGPRLCMVQQQEELPCRSCLERPGPLDSAAPRGLVPPRILSQNLHVFGPGTLRRVPGEKLASYGNTGTTDTSTKLGRISPCCGRNSGTKVSRKSL